jgi:hypothetical protein
MSTKTAVAVTVAPDPWKAGLEKVRLTLVGKNDETENPNSVELAPITVAKIEAATLAPLPSLDDLPEIAPIGEVAQKAEGEIRQTKEWLQRAAGKLLDYEQARATLNSVARRNSGDTALSETYRTQSAAVDEGIKRVTAVDPEMQERLEFAKLMESIKRCNHMNRGSVEVVLADAVTNKRYRVVTPGEVAILQGTSHGLPKYTIFFWGKTYAPIPFPEPAPGQHALEVELMKLVMKARGENRSSVNLAAGKVGYYYLHCPRGQRDKFDGHALVKLYDANDSSNGKPDLHVRAIEAIGNASFLADAKSGRTSIPLTWIVEGKITSRRRLPQADFDRGLSLLKKYRFMLELTNNSQPQSGATTSN